MKAWIAAASCVGCLVGAPVLAADSGFYFGVFGGRADYEFESPAPAAGVIDVPIIDASPGPWSGAEIPAIAIDVNPRAIFLPIGWLPDSGDDESTSWGVTAGYRIVRYAAVELNYLNFGTLKASDTIDLYPVGTTEFRRELEVTGPTLSAIGTLPIVGGWSAYARIGVLFADMTSKSWLGTASGETSFASQNLLWGAGTQFDWGDHWSVRLDFQRFESVGDVFQAGKADIDLLTLGVLFRL